MAKKLQEQYAEGLLAMGYVELDPGARYRVFHNEAKEPKWFWLGKNGAVRHNNVKRIDGSIPAGDKRKGVILAKGMVPK